MDTETENTEETTPTYSMGYYAPVYYT
jgi:hypothetical protein